MKLLSAIEHFLLGIRDFFWNYPDNFILEENSFVRSLRKNYLRARPFSHALFVLLIFFSVTSIVFSDISAILRIDKATFIEGVIVGKDENDQIQKVLWINPLIVTNTQIKRDLSELVYEPLLHVNQDNEVQLVLAESYANLGGGKSYRFKLRENVFWHDGKKFTSEDVVETFKLLQSLEFGNQTSSVYSKAAAKINIKKIDDYRFEFSLKDQNTIIPNFFEIISFKVLPAHLIKGLNSSNIIYAEQKINSNPIGTGPFIVGPLNLEEIELKKNKSYYNNVPKLEKMIFRLYKDQEQAVSDLKTGQIHALTGVNSDSVQELSVIPNLKIYKSNVIYNQYWGLYFNLADQNKSSVKEVKVRQAISSAINKNFINEALVGSAIEAKGPIPETSFAFSKSEKYVYNIKSAKTLLDRAGWKVVKGQKYRMSSKGVVLELNLVYVKNIDRDKLVEVIQRDLAAVGIKVNPVAKTISEVNNDYVLPGFFDI
ncbi:MAG: ABC-type dipeptide transport system, periplasmic component, partial [candidate division WS6 bacterium GW2011_GWA2_37_6]